ncbi:MAG: hypothetical protein QG657_709 [Acidobacteriota bacterium]|nr:hypothetical protein [Acidobacteriota bacterium]
MSVNFNLISATLDDSVHASIITDVKAIEAKLPFAITLPTEERIPLRGTGLKNIDFIEKAYEYAVKNPDLPPQYLEMTEFGKDVRLLKQIQVLMQHLVPLVDKLKDTYAVVGSEAYSSARIFYHHVKNASNANIPGASAIAKELAKRFHVVKSTSTPDPGATTTGAVKTAAKEIKTEDVAGEVKE